MQKETLVASFIKFNNLGETIYLEYNGNMSDALDYMRFCYPDAVVIHTETEISETPLIAGTSRFTGEPVLSTPTIKDPRKAHRKFMWLMFGSYLMSLLMFIAIVSLAIAFNFIWWLVVGIAFVFLVTVGIMKASKAKRRSA